MKTALVFHPEYLRHRMPFPHPESPERVIKTLIAAKKYGVLGKDVILIEPEPASVKDALMVHSDDYIKQLAKGRGWLDADTPIYYSVLRKALFAVGGGITAVRDILAERYLKAFVLTRPPGHHAGRRKGGGFCYLNNIAIAAEWIRRQGLNKIFILDWDAHHGDGTQAIFYHRPEILFISIHQDPSTLYPGTGYIWELGEGEGKGFNVCIPLPPGSSDPEYGVVFEKIVEPLVYEFKPDMILVSAGQDPHFTDPLTGLALTINGFRNLARRVSTISEKLCHGRLVMILEGGYSVRLGVINLAVLTGLAGLDLELDEPPGLRYLYKIKRRGNVSYIVQETVRKLRMLLSNYWRL